MKYQETTQFSRFLKTVGVKSQVVDFWVRQFWPSFSVERVFARVTSIEQACHNAITITLKPNFNFGPFTPGQHVSVSAKIDGRLITRTYSPTLLKNKQLQITIKNAGFEKASNGYMSLFLNTQLKVGSLLELSQPYGDLTWDKISPSDQYIFCAGGAGITPLFSLLNATAHIKNKKIELFYWAKTNQQFCFEKELHMIQQQNPLIKVHFFTTQNANPESRIQKKHFEFLNQFNGTKTFIACGPQGFIDETKKISQAYNSNFFSEAQTQLARTSGNLQHFELNWNGQKMLISNQTTILEALEQHGLKPAHGCRMGICKTCTCLKNTGAVENLKDQRISIQSNEEIQICVSRLLSDTSIASRN